MIGFGHFAHSKTTVNVSKEKLEIEVIQPKLMENWIANMYYFRQTGFITVGIFQDLLFVFSNIYNNIFTYFAKKKDVWKLLKM